MTLLLLLLVIGLASLSAGQSSECPYANLVGPKETHILCLPPNTACRTVNRGVSEADKNLILKLHNDVRNKVAAGQQSGANGVKLPQAANMRLMVWSPELAKIAQAITDQCSLNIGCYNCRSTEDYDTGVNQYYSYYQSQPPRTEWQKAINSWASGANKMTSIQYSRTRPGLFGQMIWGQTKDIGCGRTMYRGETLTARYMDLYVCIYGPAGNYFNRDLYEAGPPCSDCGYGETCCASNCTAQGITQQYPNLCRAPPAAA